MSSEGLHVWEGNPLEENPDELPTTNVDIKKDRIIVQNSTKIFEAKSTRFQVTAGNDILNVVLMGLPTDSISLEVGQL